MAHIETLPAIPSIEIDSGGGRHCYWLLDEPFILDTAEKRVRAQDLQARWVALVGGDPAAKDLARVLRIPGTRNYKYTPPRPVEFVRAEFDRLYTLDTLEAELPPAAPRTETQASGQAIDLTGNVQRARRALQRLSKARCDDYGTWIAVGQALTELGDTGRDLWIEWSKKSEKFDEDVCKAKWATFKADPNKLTLASLFYWANQDDPNGNDGRLTIDISTIDLPTIMLQAWHAIVASNDPPTLFRRAGKLARLETTDSDALAAALTTTEYSDRLLGKSEQVSLPVRCVWVATANNPTLSTEISRRCIRIRIDPRVDKPWQRKGFKHPKLRTWVAAHRGELIWAALVICRYGLQHGAAGRSLGSYEAWSDVLGCILEGAGFPGFLGNLDALYDRADVEGAAWRALVTAWWETYHDAPQLSGDLFPLVAEVESDLLFSRHFRTIRTLKELT